MVLMIDNYDSFTYNLVQYLAELGAEVRVVRNDEMSVDGVQALAPRAIVISPGPSAPERAGISLELIRRLAGQVPMLGVCLGHQAIGQAFGGKVVRAPVPVHGKLSLIEHQGAGVFRGINAPFHATRYHSLTVDRESMPAELKVTAKTNDGVVMGLAHATLPVHGVQFHPESIASEHGHLILRNFLDLADAWNRSTGRQRTKKPSRRAGIEGQR
jgi:anthranilate synthase component 2